MGNGICTGAVIFYTHGLGRLCYTNPASSFLLLKDIFFLAYSYGNGRMDGLEMTMVTTGSVDGPPIFRQRSWETLSIELAATGKMPNYV